MGPLVEVAVGPVVALHRLPQVGGPVGIGRLVGLSERIESLVFSPNGEVLLSSLVRLEEGKHRGANRADQGEDPGYDR